MISLIKRWTHRQVSRFIERHNYRLLSENELSAYVGYTHNLLKEIENSTESKQIDSIVFSKDRAMQLYAFLASYTEKVKNRGRMYVLYKCTSQRHQKSYEQLRASFGEENFVFIAEEAFREQLIRICENSAADRIIFYVDDMIFTHEVDYDVLSSIDTTQHVVALSRGMDMDYSVVMQKQLNLPPFTKQVNNLSRFNWNHSIEYSDWTFPLGVSGYMYGRIEITAMLKSILFKAPNSLENAMQIFLPYFINRYGLCSVNASCVCVHANLVQTEKINKTLGTYSIEELLDLWEKGKRIDLLQFYDKPMNETQQKAYTFINSQD